MALCQLSIESARSPENWQSSQIQRLAILAEKRQDKEKQHYEKEEHRVIAPAQALIHKETCKSILVSLQTYYLTKTKIYQFIGLTLE